MYANITKTEKNNKSHLVVMFHGYAQNKEYFNNIIPRLPQDTLSYVSIQAPLSIGDNSYYWFPLIDSSEFSIEKVIHPANQIIHWLEQQRASYQKIILLGFSQGTELTSTIARHRPDLVNGLIILSGVIVNSTHSYFKDKQFLHQRLPIFIGSDPNDFILPRNLVNFTNEWLITYANTTRKEYFGMGHRISDEEVKDINRFLNNLTT